MIRSCVRCRHHVTMMCSLHTHARTHAVRFLALTATKRRCTPGDAACADPTGAWAPLAHAQCAAHGHMGGNASSHRYN